MKIRFQYEDNRSPNHPRAQIVRGRGECVVLVHGMRGASVLWEPIVKRLESDHRVLVVDLPGHGDAPRSGLDPAGLRFDALVDGLHETLTSVFGSEPVHLVGHSLGGALSLAYAARYSLRSCVSVDEPLALEAAKADLAPLADALKGASHDETVDALMAAEMPSSLSAEGEAVVGLAFSLPRPAQAATLGLLDPVLRESLSALASRANEVVRQLKSPTLLLLGKPASDVSLERFMGQPLAEVEHWPGAGHWLHLAEPDRFVRRLRAFWMYR